MRLASGESYATMFNVIERVRPDECHHLAAQTFFVQFGFIPVDYGER